MHHSPDWRCFYKWIIANRDVVIFVVITLEAMKFTLKYLLVIIAIFGVVLAAVPWVHRAYCLHRIKSYAWSSG